MAASWLCILAMLACVSAQQIPISTNFVTPITVPLMAGMRSNSTTLALDDASVAGANAAGTATPTEVHLSPAGNNAIYVHWATANYTVGQGNLTPLDVSKTSSVVKYGTSANSLSQTATGIVEIYNQIYNTTGPPAQGGSTALNYTSPYLHTVTLANLTPGTMYFYQVGDGTTFSGTYNFTALLAPGPSYPQRIILLADWGASHNSTVTLAHALQSAQNSSSVAPVAFYVGDFTYADTWYSNGTVSLPTSGFEGANSASYQPVWDLWQRMIEPLVSHIPTLTCVGNHEIEQQDDYPNFSMFKSVTTRWKVPSNQSQSSQYFFYSQEAGPVHAIFLAVYTDYTPGSPQANWLVKDLLSVNRTRTPWVTASYHNPTFTSDTSYKEFEDFRLSIEPFLYAAGVDAVFYGHVHSYERTFPMYNYQNNPCGTSHITIGDAGNTEGLSFLTSNKMDLEFEDLNGGCPNVTVGTRPSYIYSTNTGNDPFTYYKRALTFQADGNSTGVGNPPGYCYKSQPAWSAYREPSFGHGTLDILNATHALWQWHRNQDNNAVAADQVYIVRDTTNCPNKMYPNMRSTTGAAMSTAASPTAVTG